MKCPWCRVRIGWARRRYRAVVYEPDGWYHWRCLSERNKWRFRRELIDALLELAKAYLNRHA